MSLPTWEEVFMEAASDMHRHIVWCDGSICPADERLVNHARGNVLAGAVHYADRKVTRLGIRRFLSLCWDAGRPPGMPEWERIWRRAIWVHETAGRLHIRIDGARDSEDRARVRWLLRDPARRRTENARAAWRWASWEGGAK